MYDSIKKELTYLKDIKEDDVISNEAQNAIINKRKYEQNKTRRQPLWKDFERSCELLEVRGVRATKLSYSNLTRQQVEIKLTHRRTCLTYQTI